MHQPKSRMGNLCVKGCAQVDDGVFLLQRGDLLEDVVENMTTGNDETRMENVCPKGRVEEDLGCPCYGRWGDLP